MLVKILAAAAKACAGISTAQLRQTTGLAFDAQETHCDALNVPRFGVEGTVGCAGVQQFCEAKQMLLRENPRLDELLGLLGVQIVGL